MADGQDPVVVVTPGERTPGPPTPGMDREEAFATTRTWSGIARTEPQVVSGWHHHGDYETTIYVLSGALRMEFGPGGASTVEAVPGDFVRVPRGVVHREANPSGEPAELVLFRAGQGPSTVNVDGPPPA